MSGSAVGAGDLDGDNLEDIIVRRSETASVCYGTPELSDGPMSEAATLRQVTGASAAHADGECVAARLHESSEVFFAGHVGPDVDEILSESGASVGHPENEATVRCKVDRLKSVYDRRKVLEHVAGHTKGANVQIQTEIPVGEVVRPDGWIRRMPLIHDARDLRSPTVCCHKSVKPRLKQLRNVLEVASVHVRVDHMCVAHGSVGADDLGCLCIERGDQRLGKTGWALRPSCTRGRCGNGPPRFPGGFP